MGRPQPGDNSICDCQYRSGRDSPGRGEKAGLGGHRAGLGAHRLPGVSCAHFLLEWEAGQRAGRQTRVAALCRGPEMINTEKRDRRLAGSPDERQ